MSNRKAIFAAALILFAAAVFYRARLAESVARGKIVSVLSEWEKFGKPVDTHRVGRGRMVFTTKVSGVLQENGIIQACVTTEAVINLRPGQQFTGRRGGRTVRGKVQNVSSEPDLTTGLYTVLLKVSKPGDLAKGTILAARIEIQKLQNVLRIPKTAVFYENGRPRSWVVKNGKAELRALKLGRENDDWARVLSGVSKGETVATAGLRNIKEGNRVRTPALPGESPPLQGEETREGMDKGRGRIP